MQLDLGTGREVLIADAAVEALSRLRDRPFFLGVGFNKPHLPFAAPARYWDLYRPEDLTLAPYPYLAEDAPAHALQSYSELRSYADFPEKGPIPEHQIRVDDLRGGPRNADLDIEA